MEDLPHAAGPGERDGPEAEHPTGQALVDGDRFDLPQQQLEGAPPDEPGLDDHALVRDAEFRGPGGDERRDEQQEPGEQDDAAHHRHARDDDEEHDADDQQQHGPREDDPVEPCPIDDLLARQEVVVDVAHDPRFEGVGTPTAHR